MIKKLSIFALIFAILACPDVVLAKKKKDKKEPPKPPSTFIDPEAAAVEIDQPITNEMEQLNGEWNVVEIGETPVEVPRGSRVYLNFDVASHSLYGNTGANTINAMYKLNKDNKISFSDMIQSHKSGGYQDVEKELMESLKNVASVSLVKVGETEYMELKNKHRDLLVKLRRQNLDFMNGPWLVKIINGENVIDRDIKLVNDIDMQTVNITSGCNIINGVITIDTFKEFAIEYEDLKSSHHQCPNIDTETRLLIALEETQYCRKLGDSEVELLTTEHDEMGKKVNKTLVVLEKVKL